MGTRGRNSRRRLCPSSLNCTKVPVAQELVVCPAVCPAVCPVVCPVVCLAVCLEDSPVVLVGSPVVLVVSPVVLVASLLEVLLVPVLLPLLPPSPRSMRSIKVERFYPYSPVFSVDNSTERRVMV